MIRVVHNTIDHVLGDADCENLGDVIERCGGSRADVPHLLTRIRIDGLDLPEDSFNSLEEISIEGVKKIEVESRPSIEIALSSLRHSSEYVDAVRRAGDKVVNLFRTGRSDEANDLLAQLSDSLGVLVAAVSGVVSVIPSAREVLIKPMTDLTRWLEQILEGQSNGDWVHVADILEYEVDPQLDEWQRVMRHVLAESS